ncbi:DUF3102 domain-containing protein (plasmid) [Alicyclobacillus curvatus]|nr:DUF3102 domain-containing protein [Alicyclobacillus curvatus]
MGKRLKQIRDDKRFKGRYLQWLENEVEFTRQTASRFIQAAEQFGNGTTSYHVQSGKLFEIPKATALSLWERTFTHF